MGLVEMIMPKMGESIIEATVIRWLKKEGDKIEKDESVLEVATDKVDTEVPAISSGYLHKILIKEGDVAPIGHALAVISSEPHTTQVPDQSALQDAQNINKQVEEIIKSTVGNTEANSLQGRFYSPLVLNIAKEEKISMSELENIPGTGKDNRVTKYDILEFISNRKSGAIKEIVPSQNSSTPIVADKHTNRENNVTQLASENTDASREAKAVSFNGEFEIVEMDRMRKIIAQRMVDSQKISATVTSFVEADMTNIVYWRNKIKHEFMRREGEGLTYTPIFVEAIAKALKDFPLMNSSIDGERIILKKDINIGIAVALQDGNLIVPVIKNADRYNISGLTKAVNALVKKARNNKLTPDDLADGTYSISNVGSFGNVMGTPVLVQPQVGIMALGSIRKKPAVIETEQGDTIGIRHMMFLSHSYDHRIVDGALGGSFVKKVADYLEDFDPNRKLA